MAIVGIALMEVLSDANGVALMTIAVSILVPLYNVLAVIALELCSGRKVSSRDGAEECAEEPPDYRGGQRNPCSFHRLAAAVCCGKRSRIAGKGWNDDGLADTWRFV